MKRRSINGFNNAKGNYIPIDIPETLKDYAEQLRLLEGVPLTYLLSEGTELPEESIRFFAVDVNWTDALLDGAFSIGRVCGLDMRSDADTLKAVTKGSNYADTPRMKRMHANHKNSGFLREDVYEDYQMISGFIMRSQLVTRMKGMHLYGYDKNGAPKNDEDEGTPLQILRMDQIAEGILLCLFHGEVYEIIINEPKTGLRFGVSSVDSSGIKISRSIDLRSVLDSQDLGKRIESFCIDKFTDDNGRLHVKQLANAIEKRLKSCGKLGDDQMDPSRLAFEMIAVAHRAKMTSSRKENSNGFVNDTYDCTGTPSEKCITGALSKS